MWTLRAANVVRGQLELGLNGGLGGAGVLPLHMKRDDDTTDFYGMGSILMTEILVLNSLVIYHNAQKHSVVLN